MSRLLTLYSITIKLCPKGFQDRFGPPMIKTMEDMLNDQPNRLGRCKVWLQATVDLPISITQLNTLVIGEAIMNDTPSYGKQTSLIGSLLLIPFIVIVGSGVLKGQQPIHNHAWLITLIFCLIALPAVAFIINAMSYTAWFMAAAQEKRSIFRRLLTVNNTWPMLVAGGIGLVMCLFVPFHDSAHCVVGNPIRIIHNPHQTVQCISDGFMGGE